MIKIHILVTSGPQRKHVLLAGMYSFSLGFPSKLCRPLVLWVISLFPKVKGEKNFFFNDICRKNEEWWWKLCNSIPIYRCSHFELPRKVMWSVNGTQAGPGEQGSETAPPEMSCSRGSCLSLVPGLLRIRQCRLWSHLCHWQLCDPTKFCFLSRNVELRAWKPQDQKGRGDLIFLHK